MGVDTLMALTIKYVRSDAAGGGDGSANNSSDAWTLVEAYANATAGTEVRIINTGTYILSSNLSLSNTGTDELDNRIVFSGRDITDSVYENIYINGGTYYISLGLGNDYITLQYMDIYSTYAYQTVSGNGNNIVLYRCKIKNGNTNSGESESFAFCAVNLYRVNSIIDCYLENSSSIGNSALSVLYCRGSLVTGCKIITPGVGLYAIEGVNCFNNLIVGTGNNASLGVYSAPYVNGKIIRNNTIYNFKTALNLSPGNQYVANNIFHTISSGDPSDPGYLCYCRDENLSDLYIINNKYFNVDQISNYDLLNYYDNEELTEDPFVDVGVDFSLNNTEGGGANCRGTGVSPAFSWTWNH